MVNIELVELIKELGDDLSFLPQNQAIETIASIIDQLLPLAILKMRDDRIDLDESKLTAREYLERRKWGDERKKLEARLSERRELLEHVKIAKASMMPEVSYGGMVTLIQPYPAGYETPFEPQMGHVNTEYKEQLSIPTIRTHATKTTRLKARGANISYNVDDSLVDKIRGDIILFKFCSVIEKAARRIAAVHKNEFLFSLTEKVDAEYPDWRRIILTVDLPDVNFDSSLKLWSLISNVTRKELDSQMQYLSEGDQHKFKALLSNFNVEMKL
ncbi:MAG: hypothetical protein QXJ74_00895 [Nitrososphaera sp.]